MLPLTSLFFLIGIFGAAAKLGNFNTAPGVHDTIEGICTETNLPKYSKVAKLCEDLGANGLDISLDDTVLFGGEARDGLVGYKGPTFNMREILAAEDAEAAYNEIEARYQQQTERKLFVDYGWCSTNCRWITGALDDSSDYCNDSQTCDSFAGCGSELSACCITHDKCLQGPPHGSTNKCVEVNCKGATCDKNLSTCAWNVECCRYNSWGLPVSCDGNCITASSTVSTIMGGVGGVSPQSSHNTEGEDSDSVCQQ